MTNDQILREIDILTRPYFILMIGPPGCGKSSLSKYIPGTIISMEIPPDKRYKRGVEGQLRYKMIDAMLARDNIIIDRICMTKKARASQLKQMPFGYSAIAINLHNVEIPDLIKRMSTRPEAHRRIPEAALRKMFEEFEPPLLAEGFSLVLTRTGS